MEKHEIKAVINYLVRKRMLSHEIKRDLEHTLKDSAPSASMIRRWVKFFEKRRELEEKSKKRSFNVRARVQAKIDRIHYMVLLDSRIRCREMGSIMNVPKECVANILRNLLHMKRFCTRWVPQILTDEQKLMRIRIAKKNLALYRSNPETFMERLVTTETTWIHFSSHDDRESGSSSESESESEETGESSGSGSVLDAEEDQPDDPSAPKKAKVESTSNDCEANDNDNTEESEKKTESPKPKKPTRSWLSEKVLASVFWDSKGIILIDFHWEQVTSEYYANLLEKLAISICENRPNLDGKTVYLHQTSTQRQNSNSVITMAKMFQLGYQIVDHPAHSPDLAPSDYYLYPALECNMAGHHFTSSAEVLNKMEEILFGFEDVAIRKAIASLPKRWAKCIQNRGDYVPAYMK